MARKVTVSGTVARRLTARAGGERAPKPVCTGQMGAVISSRRGRGPPPLPMPWISPPSRFLGAKGATRPRPVPGVVSNCSPGTQRRDGGFLRDLGPRSTAGPGWRERSGPTGQEAQVKRSRIGAEVLTDVLARAGVDTIFGLPGSTEAALLETLRERARLRYVLGLHEGAVVSMADGYARVTGTPGVVGLHTSVGTLNGASQIYNCYRDGSPVVVTAGHKDRTVLSEDGFCALPDLPEAVRPFTKWAHQTLSTAELGADLWRALHAAMTVPAGPAYLAVPEDFLRDPVPADAPDPPVANSALWSGWPGGRTVPNEAVCA